MLTTSRTSRFKRDFKRIKAGPHGKELDRIFSDVFASLLVGDALPPRYRDHALSGEYHDCRECHLKPDLLLIYRKVDGDTLQLTRLGSHSELFDK
jgi:mRNA interferase YafQ